MKIGVTDNFERQYMAKFRAMATPHGIFVGYEVDRAGRDIGLHFTQPKQSGGKIVLPSLAWFQMKGIMPSTLSLAKYKAASEVSVELDVSHLRFWFVNVQPTYLVVYVGCAKEFLAIDVKQWVHQNYGERILTLDQKTITVRVRKENKLDDHLFRLIMERNLVPALRTALAQEDEPNIRRFLRDSSVVKWLARSQEAGGKCRLVVVKYMSKMRTEAYFEGRTDNGAWERVRGHWEYAMGDIATAFPFLSFRPKLKVVEYQRVEIEDYGDDVFERTITDLRFAEPEDDDESFDEDEEIDGECLLPIGDCEYSYSVGGYGEMMVHELGIELNAVGRRWAETLKALETAEIISVSTSAEFISVAPWHSRDV